MSATSIVDATLHPQVLWADRKNCLFLTVELQGANNLNVDIKEQSLDFACESDGQKYAFQLEFPEAIDTEASKYTVQRNVQMKIVKKEAKRWEKIQKGAKLPWIKCDWAKWVDSDDEDKQMDMGDFDMGGMNFGGMPGMGGMGGMPGMGGMGDMGMGGMPGMGGMGGMGGMPGMGGMGGMGGMPGMGGMGGMDMGDMGGLDSDDDVSDLDGAPGGMDGEDEEDGEEPAQVNGHEGAN